MSKPDSQVSSEKKTVPYWKLYSVASPSTFLLLFFGFLSAVVLGATTPLFYLQIGEIFDKMEEYQADANDFYDAVVRIVYILLIIGAVALVTGYIAVFCFMRVGAQISTTFKSMYFQALLHQEVSFYDSHNCAEMPTTLTTDCYKIQQATGEKAMVFIKVASYVLIGLIVCFFCCPVLTLLALGQGPIIFIGMGLVGFTHAVRIKRKQEAYAVADGIAEESLSEVKTVAACTAQQSQVSKYKSCLHTSTKTTVSLGLLHGLGWSFVSIARCVSAAVVFWYGAKIMKDGKENWIWGDQVDASDIVVVFFVVGATFQFLGNIVPSIHAIVEGKSAGFRAFELINRVQTMHDGDLCPEIHGQIEFRDVSFSYPKYPDLRILDKLSFTAEKGKTLGIVGESGAGKSTVVQLIERFYDPSEGSIFLDGVDLRRYRLSHLRESISLVSQEPILFNTTIKENLLLGSASASDSEISLALDRAAASEFIRDFPDLLETTVGTKGSNLSCGQKQRIAIARAILKRPKVILLDEATSSLDAENEAAVQRTLETLMDTMEVTCIFIAQKLTSIRKCGKIVLIQKGGKAEEGTHQELMELRGRYFRMVTIQTTTESSSGDVSVSDASDTRASSDAQSSQNPNDDSTPEPEPEDSLSTRGAMRRVLSLSRKYWYLLLLGGGMAIIAGATFPVFGFLIAEEMHYITEETGGGMVRDCKMIAMWLFLLAGVSFIAYFLMSFSTTIATAHMTSDLRIRSFESLLNHDSAFFDKKENSPGALTQSLSGDCEKVNNAGGPLIAMAVMMLASLVIGCVLGLIYAWKLGLLITLCTPLLVIGMMRGYLVQVEGSELKQYDRANTICSDSVMNIRTVYSLNAQATLVKSYMSENTTVSQSLLRSSHLLGLFFGFGLMAMFYVYALAFWYGAYQVKHEDLKTEKMNIALYTCLMGSIGMMVASIFAPDLAAGRKAANRLFSIIDYESTVSTNQEKGLQTEVFGTVEFRHVSFLYPTRASAILDDLNFTVPAGSSLGITGYSGAGKSTIVQLLFRFYDVTQGQVLVDGKDVKDFNLGFLRSQMAVVFQEPVLFTGSIRDNIAFGCEDVKEEEVEAAASKAQAARFISRHAEGLRRDVGVRGNNLSGGQKQRIAIARAILRNPKILVFDEATSALDSKTEQKLQAALRNAQSDRTCIVIAHRLSTLQHLDRIAIIDSGRIKEIGDTKKLLSDTSSAYATLVRNSEK